MIFIRKNQRTKAITILLCAVLSVLLVSCFPDFERLKITQLSTPPIASSMVSDHIDITAGIGVIVEVEPVSGNSESYDESDDVELESENIDIMRVMKGERFREFAIIGCETGNTHMRVLINGSHEKDILVTVR